MVNSVVDPGNFIHIVGYVLHFIPPYFLPKCPTSTSKYLRKPFIPKLNNLDFGFPQVGFVHYDQ
jgi:hypothetical protein